MNLNSKGKIMSNSNQSRNLAARPRASRFRACRDVASARIRILFLLAGLLAMSTLLRADNPPTYLFEIDSSAVPVGAIFNPGSVALDSENNVYAGDWNNDRIVKFGGGGTYLTQWGSAGSGNGQFSGPDGIAVDSGNNVYVVDFNNRVEKFSSSGSYLTQWGSQGTTNGQFEYPEGIAVDSSNNVYVTDIGNNRVEKFDRNGNYLTQWGSYGSGNGQFYISLGSCGGQQQQRLCARRKQSR